MPRDRYDDRDDDHDDRDDRRRDSDYDRPRRRREYDDDPPPKSGGGKTVLIVLAIVGGVMVLVIVGLGLLIWPAMNRVRDASARMQTSNNIMQLNLGLHNYDSANAKLPGPYVGPTEGGLPASANPSDRLSWRYSILPYIEQDNVYRMMDPRQAWNSPTNRLGADAVIKTFSDPLDPPTANTRFRCFYNNGALFDTDPTRRTAVYTVPDGTSNTVMFVEAVEMVPWAQFNEFAFDPNGTPPPLGHPTRDVFLAGMADGSVRTVKKTVSPSSLKAAITRNGNDVVGSDFD
jgi:hypothetical protein